MQDGLKRKETVSNVIAIQLESIHLVLNQAWQYIWKENQAEFSIDCICGKTKGKDKMMRFEINMLKFIISAYLL